MMNFFLHISSCIIILGAPLLAADAKESLEEAQQLLDQVSNENGLKNIEKSTIKQMIIQHLTALLSSNTLEDKELLEKALKIAQNKFINQGKTKQEAIKLTTVLKNLLATLTVKEEREAKRLIYEQEYQQMREERQKQLLSERQASLKAFFDSVTKDSTHAILKWEYKYSDDDIKSIVAFLKEHPDISNFTLDSASNDYSGSELSDEIKPIISQLSEQLNSFTQVGGRFHPGLLKNFIKLRNFTLSKSSVARLTDLPQGIENLDLSNILLPKIALEDILTLKNLKTINLKGAKTIHDPGAEKDNIILPITDDYISKLKTEIPGLIITL